MSAVNARDRRRIMHRTALMRNFKHNGQKTATARYHLRFALSPGGYAATYADPPR